MRNDHHLDAFQRAVRRLRIGWLAISTMRRFRVGQGGLTVRAGRVPGLPIKKFELSAALILSLPIGLAACSKMPEDASTRPLPVETFLVGEGAAHSIDRFPITIARDREANIAFRVGGVIEALHVRAGQLVQSGQVLATLQSTPYAANRVRAAAEVNRLQHAARRNEELLKAGAVSVGVKEDVDDALAAASAALSVAQYDEESSTMRAPFPATVLERDAEAGETVAAGQRVLRLADLRSAVIAKASVPAQVARNLHIGDTAQIRVGAVALTATTRHIGALSDPRTGTVTVDLLVQQAAPIASGATGEVEFPQIAARNQDVTLLPPEAMVEAKGDMGVVFVLNSANSTAQRTAVRVFGFDGEMIRIAGLSKGVKVVTSGAGFVRDGQKVQEIRP